MDTNELFDGDLLNISDNPNTESWKYIPLFKDGSIGEIRVWQIGFDAEGEQLKTVHGTLITSKGENGKLITALHPIVTNKSGRSLQEQALLEARKRYLDQYSKGYLPRGSELPAELNGTEPMLAKTLKLSSDKTSCKSNEVKFDKYPCNVQPKLDGIRCLSRYLPDGTIQTRSRNNKTHEAPLTHIKEELKTFMKYLGPNVELDGELYSMDLTFDELSGVIRTKKTKHPKHDLVNYYIFDIIEPKLLCCEKRYELLVNSYNKFLEDGNKCSYVKIIQSYTAESEEQMLEYHNTFVSQGFEGIIIRRYGIIEVSDCCSKKFEGGKLDQLCKKCDKAHKLTIYRSKRTNALMKYKQFQDEEATIVGFEVGIGTEEGAILYQVKDPRGNVFTVRPRGTVEERRALYQKRKKLMGLPLTIRYQELSKDGVPRFPVGIAIRNYE